MEKTALFEKIGGIMHGGDYNPEQWLDRPDILEKDIVMMKKAGVNCATLGVFAWSTYEPNEGEYHFEWLKEIMDNLYANGIYTILATPSGARPAWLDEKYPEAMRVDSYGHRAHHGVRHNHCMSSPIFREKIAAMDRKLAENLANHPGMLLWHISNEFGGECYCPHCVKRFQNYLAEKFDHDIDKLNHAWWTTFWSHRYNNFEQIEPPYANGEFSIMGLNLEWKRFTTWSMTDFMKWEISVLRDVKADIPVTTNFMKLYDGLDYREMAEELDLVTWDSYPAFHNDRETLADTLLENAFDHAVIRSMKPDRPFMLMESVPGAVNWHPFNKYKRPGVHRLACFQAVASGSDTVQYFQWRKGRGSFEQYHGAVVDHLGTDDTRIFKEVEEVGQLLRKIPGVAGTIPKNQAAMIFDWDNRWAIDNVMALAQETKNYEKTCMGIWEEFMKMGIELDVISSDSDFSKYKVLVAPMLYVLHDGVGEKIKSFVANGGQILATYFTGYVDKNLLCHLGGFPGDGLSEVFGIISEEIDTLYPTDRNAVKFTNGRISEVKDYAEMLRVSDAEVLGTYETDYYGGMAAVTKKKYGEGNAYYVACRMAPADMKDLFCEILSNVGISGKELPEGVEYHVRYGAEKTYEFYLNASGKQMTLSDVSGHDLIGDKEIAGELILEPCAVAVIEK